MYRTRKGDEVKGEMYEFKFILRFAALANAPRGKRAAENRRACWGFAQNSADCFYEGWVL